MANDEERREPEELGQDPFVERLRPDPSQPPEPVTILQGVLGDSDREGYKRLYFTRDLDHYAEFRAQDVTFTEPIAPDQPPFLGQQATRAGIKRNATIEYTRVRTPKPVDEFDLDVRLRAREGSRREPIFPAETWEGECPAQPWTWGSPTCDAWTCVTCQTQCDRFTCWLDICAGPTRVTCPTGCAQATCFGFTCLHTCGPVCGGTPVELRSPNCTGSRTGCLPA
jgi:hypothetical protein